MNTSAPLSRDVPTTRKENATIVFLERSNRPLVRDGGSGEWERGREDGLEGEGGRGEGGGEEGGWGGEREEGGRRMGKGDVGWEEDEGMEGRDERREMSWRWRRRGEKRYGGIEREEEEEGLLWDYPCKEGFV